MNDNTLRRLLIPIFVLAFLLVRLLVLFYPDSSGWSVVDDELPTGNIAVDFGRDLVLPIPAYQFKPFAAGTMIEGILTVPFRALFGPNLLSLKAAAMSLQMLAMVFWLLAMWRLGGRVAAISFGLLAVFSPPAWLHLSHMAWANHAEQTLFIGLLFWLLTRSWSGRGASNPPSIATMFAYGFVAGFGVYFAYSGLPLLLFLIVFLVAIGGRSIWRSALPATFGGLLLGLAPLAWSASYFGLRALGRIDTYTGYAEGEMVTAGRGFLERNMSILPEKISNFFMVDLPASSLYPHNIGRWLFFTFVMALLIIWLIGEKKSISQIWRNFGRGGMSRDEINGLLAFSPLLFGAIYLAIFLFSGFRVLTPEQPNPTDYGRYRYLAPLFPVAFAIIGMGLQTLWQKWEEKIALRLSLITFAALAMLALNVPFYRTVVAGPFSNDVLEVRGDYYLPIVERLAIGVSRNEWTRGEQLSAVERLPNRYHHLFFEKMGKVGEIGKVLGLQMIGADHPGFENDLFTGYGRFIGSEISREEVSNWPAMVDRKLQEKNLSDSPYRGAFLGGIGTELSRAGKSPPAGVMHQFETWKTIRPSDYNAFAFGVGRFAGATLSIHLLEDVTLPDEFWFGYGRQVRQNAETMLLFWSPVANTLLPGDREKRGKIIKGFAAAGVLFEE